jgi:hypothetical protein
VGEKLLALPPLSAGASVVSSTPEAVCVAWHSKFVLYKMVAVFIFLLPLVFF